MEYLQLEEIGNNSERIRAALNDLMGTKAFIFKRGARQWQFLRDSLERLLSTGSISEFDSVSTVQAAQYKFEIEDRMRRFYLRPGHMVDFVFTLVHKSSLHEFIDDFENYPLLAGYALLIRDWSADRRSVVITEIGDLKQYFEKVIAEANDAEFRAYAALPEIQTEELNQWFCSGSPAFNSIYNILSRHSKKQWVISNPYNPSTKRLLKVKVKKVDANEAMVDTIEYWYLRWWDALDGSYTYPYRETNRQMYVLKKEDGQWKVFDNLRRQPRSSAPNRTKSLMEK